MYASATLFQNLFFMLLNIILCILLYVYATLLKAGHGAMQLEDLLELVITRRELIPVSGFLPHRDMTSAVESKNHFLPSANTETTHHFISIML